MTLNRSVGVTVRLTVPLLWLLSGVQLSTLEGGEGQAVSLNWLIWWRAWQIASTGGKAAWGEEPVPSLQTAVSLGLWVCVFVFGIVDKPCYLGLPDGAQHPEAGGRGPLPLPADRTSLSW